MRSVYDLVTAFNETEANKELKKRFPSIQERRKYLLGHLLEMFGSWEKTGDSLPALKKIGYDGDNWITVKFHKSLKEAHKDLGVV